MKSHLKRIAAPKSWHIERKVRKWVVRANPGAHEISTSFPLAFFMRDILGYANSMREVKNILTKKTILVDGKRVRDPKMSVGLMDVITSPDTGESFRILLDKKGKLYAKRLDKKTDAEIKPLRIENKTKVNNKTQLNLSFSNNLLVEKDTYKTGDTLVMSLSKKEVKAHLKLEKGALVYLIGGARIGEVGVIESIEGKKITANVGGQSIDTLKEYAFVIGKEKPVIEI